MSKTLPAMVSGNHNPNVPALISTKSDVKPYSLNIEKKKALTNTLRLLV
jgi:hypothetical protein